MIVVVIAGGSGTRLWPLSTSGYPKHLLKLTGERSLLQSTYDRAVKTGSDKIYIVTDGSHADHVKEQLPDLSEESFIVEPARRGTAGCIIAALARISTHQHDDEPIIFMHADHYIRDVEGFCNTVEFAAKAAKEMQRLTLLGVEPDYPATGFGYIKKAESVNDNGFSFVYEVDSFIEKPDHDTAQEYLKTGHYLWNMGYFVAPLDVFTNTMQQYAPKLYGNFQKLVEAEGSDEAFKEAYLALENEAIDYALLELTPNLLVVPGSFDWMDLGSYKDLHEANDRDDDENHIAGNVEKIQVQNAYIRNDEDKPIAVIGLDNIVVVNTPQGILVARKDLSQQVGEIAKKIQAKQ
jgi:mannose-1-phosphate guanylyltransferase/mannose-6-phosphate isomerase